MTEDAEALRAEIQVTREELGETAEALMAKADVKGRTKEAAADAKHRAVEKVTVAKDRAVEKATVAKDRAVEKATGAKDRAVEAASGAKERAVGAVRERPIPPLVVAAIGAAAIAIAIYASRRR
jgi:hypothetical protein